VARLPLVSGSRVTTVRFEAGDVALAPPPPLDPILDVTQAVRDALHYPLSGHPIGALAQRGGRATIVLDHPALPFPGAELDPRQEALATVVDELERLGVPSERQTLLVAGGLGRRAGQQQLETLLRPTAARRFHGTATVHDCTSEELRPLANDEGVRVAPELLETDLLVVVSAAQTVLHGGPAALVGASDAATARRLTADSLLEPSSSPGWELALAVEQRLTLQVPVLGVSLTLDHPRLTGRYRGYPDDLETVARLARSPARYLLNLVPASFRRSLLDGLQHELAPVGAFAGPPSVAHAEALLRGVELRATRISQPLDAIVLPVPWLGPHLPREQVNPITAAYTVFGLALRLWRDSFPLTEGATAVLLHPFGRRFGHGPGAPYGVLFHLLRAGSDDEALAAAEEAAARDPKALREYHKGRAPHPLLPYADWAACRPALARLGRVIVAGCRDAGAARALGFVPSHSVATALEMAHGVAEGRARVGFLLAPPYSPLLVGGSES
jgi:Lactate racemase N-terminal domain